MLQLLSTQIVIALLDSTSIIPLTIVILIVLLTGPAPVVRSAALLFGIFTSYFAVGAAVLLGLRSIFDQVQAYTVRLWQNPYTEELVLQIILGLVLCLVALRMGRKKKGGPAKQTKSGMTAWQAFVTGWGLVLVGLPGAVPYFAAIDILLRAQLNLAGNAAALLVYNLAFIAPLALLLLLRLLLGDRGTAVLERVRQVFETWGQRIIIALLCALGVLLVVDGIGWFLGYPVIPV